MADLESLRDPNEPRDPVTLRHWWRMNDERGKSMRMVDVRDEAAVAYVGVSHDAWSTPDRRFGAVRPLLRQDVWTAAAFGALVGIGETWLRDEEARTSVVRVRADFQREIDCLEALGYHEDRRTRTSELDLVANRDKIHAAAAESMQKMRERGVELTTLGEDGDPEKYRQLYEMMVESELDIPTTVPWHTQTFDEWRRFWLENPAIREDRFWIAREGGTIVGTSVLDTPVTRGVPWTAYTGTLRRVRGRGIARALKYQSMAQAIDAGYTRVRTNNDADNPPILKINGEMGYELVAPVIELHRNLNG